MVFGLFKRTAKALDVSAKKYSGQTDFLEAVCAFAALVANADGDIEDSEVKKTMSILRTHPQLGEAFDERTIEATASKMFERVQTGLVGRMGMLKEIEDIADDAEKAETVFIIGMDIAMADGEIEPEEQKVLDKVAAKLRIDPAKFDI